MACTFSGYRNFKMVRHRVRHEDESDRQTSMAPSDASGRFYKYVLVYSVINCFFIAYLCLSGRPTLGLVAFTVSILNNSVLESVSAYHVDFTLLSIFIRFILVYDYIKCIFRSKMTRFFTFIACLPIR